MNERALNQNIQYESIIDKALADGYTRDQLAFAYCRVSSEMQEEKGNSKEDQKLYAKIYAENKGLCIINTFSVVESAWSEGRLIFNQMLNDAQEHSIKNIIFKNTDRLGRNDLDWPRCKKLARQGKIIVHLYELNMIFNKESTAEEEMFMDNTSIMARYWSNKMSQNIKRALQTKAEKHSIPCRIPLGYKYSEDGNVEFNPDEEKTVKKLFEMFDSGKYSIHEIVDQMNKEFCMTQRKNEIKFTASVYHILHNPFYAGKFRYKGKLIEGTYPAYISWQRFQTRQKMIKNKFLGYKKQNTEFILKRYVKCECGKTYLGTRIKNNNRYMYYVHECKFTGRRLSIKEIDLIKLINNEIASYNHVNDFDTIIKEIFNSYTKNYKQAKIVKFNMKKELIELEKKVQRTKDLYVEGIICKNELNSRLNMLTEKKSELENYTTKDKVNPELIKPDLNIIIKQVKDFFEVYNNTTNEGKIEILKTLSFGVKLNKDRTKLNIEFVPPFSFIFQKRFNLNPNYSILIKKSFETIIRWMAENRTK